MWQSGTPHKVSCRRYAFLWHGHLQQEFRACDGGEQQQFVWLFVEVFSTADNKYAMACLPPCAACCEDRVLTHMALFQYPGNFVWVWLCRMCMKYMRGLSTQGLQALPPPDLVTAGFRGEGRKERRLRWLWMCMATPWYVIVFEDGAPQLFPGSSSAVLAWLDAPRQPPSMMCCWCRQASGFGLCAFNSVVPFAYCCKRCIRSGLAYAGKSGGPAQIPPFDRVVVRTEFDYYITYSTGTIEMLYWLISGESWFRELLRISSESLRCLCNATPSKSQTPGD